MKEKYRIYNYLKNHEGALIALVSGATGFVIMALNFVLYITDRFYLSEWNCNLIPVENSPSRFYSLCIWFIFFIVYLFWGTRLGKTSLVFKDDFVELNVLLRRLKNMKEDLNVSERLLKDNENQIKEGGKSNEFQEISKKIDEMNREYHSIKSEIIKKKNNFEFKSILRMAMLSAKCFVPIMLIKYVQTFEFLQSLKSSLIAIGIPFLFLIPICLIMVNVLSRNKSIESGDGFFLSKAFMSDSRIVQTCISATLIFVFIVCQILFNAYVENLSKRKFEIFSVENQEYASIYESERYLIGEKVSYSDSIITFYMNNQVVVEKTNLSIVKKKFEKVEKIDSLRAALPK